VPTLAELYGVSASVRGNGDLRPERGTTVDLGLRARKARDGTVLSGAFIDVFGFVRWAGDLVSYERSSLGYVRPFNVGSARVLGAELLAGLHPLPFALLEIAATVLDPRDTSPDHFPSDVLPYRSRLRLVPRVEFEARPEGRVVNRIRTSALYVYESNRKVDRPGTVLVPEQGSLDVEIEVSMLEHLAARARFANLLDQPRVDLVGYPLPGRALYFAMEARW
jgi:vitamin B12 transporter